MTRLEIVHEFENAIERTTKDELIGLSALTADDRFAEEAGDEFVVAVTVAGLHRVLA